jgi:CDP-paratose 2-epimerase
MKRILISGICGFVGSTIALRLRQVGAGVEIIGFDNFIRAGSELNRLVLKRHGIVVRHADARSATDVEALPAVDWVIDAAANPSVLAGVDGHTSSRQVVEHNLSGTINLLEYCKSRRAGFILLSTSRVYSIPPLAKLKVVSRNNAFIPDPDAVMPAGMTAAGVSEDFSTAPPISIYGSTKLASELLALEYGQSFQFPVWINRCGVLAGAGQFGRPDQGIFSFWIHSWLRRKPLKYIGFDGSGHQVRDCLHPHDVVPVLMKQMEAGTDGPKIINLSGGMKNSFSLAQLSAWCAARFGLREVGREMVPRPFDIPWMVLDSSPAERHWNFSPTMPLEAILNEIADHARTHPDWLEISAS